ncbi:DUF1579 family protein [Streptomyces zagrosensis]|uniref:DUF1579 domain-containing protein n=1 Tax=Streptomyces zagrosensis TaxID=1042984 RepID=A0A7W9QE89_9ACTN|nr:DUF1579 family protein [Streptomyces zagrosensis]MBB5938681.1 hypothetical protein [Streptomyces zagrosensis]
MDTEKPEGQERRLARALWRRRVPIGITSAAAVGLALLAVGPVGAETANKSEAAAQSQHSQPKKPRTLPAPPQVRGLDFLLGTFTCDYAPPPGSKPATMTMTTKRAMGGHYYYTDATMQPGDVVGRATFGWDPVAKKFINQYHDNWGSSANYAAGPWKDGHLVFTGRLSQVVKPSPTGETTGVPIDLRDDYQVVNKNHFTNEQRMTFSDGTVLTGSYDCRRK